MKHMRSPPDRRQLLREATSFLTPIIGSEGLEDCFAYRQNRSLNNLLSQESAILNLFVSTADLSTNPIRLYNEFFLA